PEVGAPCQIDASSTKTRFRILGPGYIPLVVNAEGQLQPLHAPHFAPDRPEQVLENREHFGKGPNFFFHKTPDAPAGIFDLILTGEKLQYVAKAADGQLVLTPASTGTTAQEVDGRTIVTSIFTVDCDGRIGVIHEGSLFSWTISADGQSTSFVPGTHYPNGSMLAFDFDRLGIYQHHHELRSLQKRDTLRCPNGLHGAKKAGARPVSANGCGSRSNHKRIPELWFHACCNDHDICYDTCAQQSCDHCNDVFFTCMKRQCEKQRSEAGGATCYLAAGVYYEAVKGDSGCPYFAKYTGERCNCIGPSQVCYWHPELCPD
ncbi:hypothetical protein EJ03DRAFT_21840, partial [Teratosphaeria nubilosa]